MKIFNLTTIKNDLKNTFLLIVTVSLCVLAFLKVIFFDIPFPLTEVLTLLKNIGTYWMLLFMLKVLWNLVVFAGKTIHNSFMIK